MEYMECSDPHGSKPSPISRLSQTVELKIAIGTYVATGLHLIPMAGLMIVIS